MYVSEVSFLETHIMIGKSCFCAVLAVAIMLCGCGDQTKTTKVKNVQRNLVKFQTSAGDIVIALNADAAPVTVKNFLGYVQAGFYDGTIFHRVMHGFMVQGGGFTTEMKQKATNDSIANEASNGLKNFRGSIAMARGGDPDSATAQFFINHVDNSRLDYVANGNAGYAVFGKVTEGMSVVDAIARVDVTTRTGTDSDNEPTTLASIPVEQIVIKSVTVVPQ